ncbi:MAG: hypothetical protein CSA72_08400 [Rhodobacterales bacterium]|nr:MAG: hypothetical protein CSA72_08400 [Rhodobacterales bacterium]
MANGPMGQMGQEARRALAQIERVKEAPMMQKISIAEEVLPQIGAALIALADRVDELTPYLDEDAANVG